MDNRKLSACPSVSTDKRACIDWPGHLPVVAISGQSLPVLMGSRMKDVLCGDLHMKHQGRSLKSGGSFYQPFRTA
jgi:hypothetical protein